MSPDKIHSCHLAGGCEELRLRRRVRKTSDNPKAVSHSHFEHSIETAFCQFAERLGVFLPPANGFGRGCKESGYIERQVSLVKSFLLVVPRTQ